MFFLQSREEGSGRVRILSGEEARLQSVGGFKLNLHFAWGQILEFVDRLIQWSQHF